jgi:uncharacterized protein (DUF433 family)
LRLRGGDGNSAELRRRFSGLVSSFRRNVVEGDEVNWLDCEEVEVVLGRCGGRPTIKGTRIEPDLIVTEEECGGTAEQTHADFPTLSVDTILKIRTFVHGHQLGQ